MLLQFTDDEIIEALEVNYGLIAKSAKYLTEKGKDFDRYVSANMLTARINRSNDLKLRYEDIKRLVIEEAEFTVIAKMMGDADVVRRNILAAEMILVNLGAWGKKQDTTDLPGVIVNLAPSFTSTEEWQETYKKLSRVAGKEQQMSEEDKKIFMDFDRA